VIRANRGFKSKGTGNLRNIDLILSVHQLSLFHIKKDKFVKEKQFGITTSPLFLSISE